MDLIGEKMLCFKANIRENKMSSLDGKITIERELRPCIVHIPEISFDRCCNGIKIDTVLYRKSYERKTLFHLWHPVTGNAIVEYEDGNLLLMDECGNYAYCPEDRFQVNFEFPVYSAGD